jgi:hypothetical protein
VPDHSQSAATALEAIEIGDNEDPSKDEALEGEDDAEIGGTDAVESTESACGGSEVAEVAETVEILSDLLLDVRWRACWGDMEKYPIV